MESRETIFGRWIIFVMEKTEPPWTDEQVEKLREWQACGWVHPFTCCRHTTMEVEPDGFHCPDCKRVQKWAHSFMLDGAPPNPLDQLRNNT